MVDETALRLSIIRLAEIVERLRALVEHELRDSLQEAQAVREPDIYDSPDDGW